LVELSKRWLVSVGRGFATGLQGGDSGERIQEGDHTLLTLNSDLGVVATQRSEKLMKKRLGHKREGAQPV